MCPVVRPIPSFSLVALACLSVACVPAQGSMENFKAPEAGGIRRAAYELECPESQLILTDLGDSTVGVAGCGKKAIYKYAFGAGWVNNSASDDSKTGKK